MLIILPIIMNMQNKLYTIQFSQHLMTDLQSVPEQQSQNLENVNFAEKTRLLEKFELPGTRAFKSTEMTKKEFLPSSQPPFLN